MVKNSEWLKDVTLARTYHSSRYYVRKPLDALKCCIDIIFSLYVWRLDSLSSQSKKGTRARGEIESTVANWAGLDLTTE